MRKFLSIAVFAAALLISTNTAFAANNVSQMATVEGGQKVAECARSMDKGISECVKMIGCEAGM